MSNKELGSGGSREFKLVLPSLQNPYDGVFEEVYVDYLAGPERFNVMMQYRMEEENPNFIDLFDAALIFSPNPRITLKWMSLYYEIFARSSRKRGLPPIFVSEKLIEQNHRMFQLRFEGLLGREHELGSKLEEEEKKRRLRDEALSPELVLFWQSVDRDMADETSNGADEDDVLKSVGPLLTLQEFLQKQDDENAITQAYASK